MLGFSNVSRLAGGIISYTRELEKEKELESEKELEIKGGQERGEEKRALDDMNSGADSSNDEILSSSKNMEVVADPDFTMISKSVKTEDKITDTENNSMENANSVQSDRLTESETRGETKENEKEIHLTRNVLGSKFKVRNPIKLLVCLSLFFFSHLFSILYFFSCHFIFPFHIFTLSFIITATSLLFSPLLFYDPFSHLFSILESPLLPFHLCFFLLLFSHFLPSLIPSYHPLPPFSLLFSHLLSSPLPLLHYTGCELCV